MVRKFVPAYNRTITDTGARVYTLPVSGPELEVVEVLCDYRHEIFSDAYPINSVWSCLGTDGLYEVSVLSAFYLGYPPVFGHARPWITELHVEFGYHPRPGAPVGEVEVLQATEFIRKFTYERGSL